MPSPFGPNIDDTYPTGDESYLPFPRDKVRPQPGTIMPQPGTVMPSPEVMPSPGTTMPQPGYPLPGPPNRPPPDFPPFVALPTGQQQQEQQSGYTRRDNEKIRPPSIQLSRKHGGSLTQTVQNLLRNLS